MTWEQGAIGSTVIGSVFGASDRIFYGSAVSS